MKQVDRADAIMKNMNRLAHSVDESIKTIDLKDILELLVALSGRFASTRGVAVQPKFNEGPLRLKTSPFFLMNLLWLCLDFAMDAAGEDKMVELVTQLKRAFAACSGLNWKSTAETGKLLSELPKTLTEFNT
jgi:hypothetical protein